MTKTETPRLAGRGISKARATRRDDTTAHAQMQERARLYGYDAEMLDALTPANETHSPRPHQDRITLDDLLGRLDGARKVGNGWQARCPSHDDRNPSLSIHEGSRGLLLKCWSGCTLDAITTALGIEIADLFHDALDRDPHVRREAARQRETKRDHRAQERRTRGALIDSRREAEDLILSARGIDISGWPDDKLDRVMDVLGKAYRILAAERLEEEAAA